MENIYWVSKLPKRAQISQIAKPLSTRKDVRRRSRWSRTRGGHGLHAHDLNVPLTTLPQPNAASTGRQKAPGPGVRVHKRSGSPTL